MSDIERARSSGGKRRHRVEAATLVIAVVVLWLCAGTRWDRTALWADEAWSLAAVNDLWSSVRAANGSTVVFYGSLWLWGRLGTSTIWLRILSTCFATGSVIAVWLVARRIGTRRLGRLVPVLLVANPMFLWTATEVRGYALETLITVLCWYAAIRVCAEGTRPHTRKTWQSVFATLAFVGPLVHGLYFAQMVAIGCWALLDRRRERRIRLIGPGLLITLATTVALVLLDQGELGASVDGDTVALLRITAHWFLGSTGWVAVVVVAVAATGLARLVIQQVRARRSRVAPPGADAWIPVVWTFVPIGVLFAVRGVHGVWAPYYLAPIAPGVALLVGVGALQIADLIEAFVDGPSALRKATGALPLVFAGLLILNVVYREHPPVQDWRGAAREVADQARPGDAIVFTSGEPEIPTASRPGFEAAWREVPHDIVPTSLSPMRPLGRVLRVDDHPTAQRLSARLAGHDRVWIVDYQGMLERPGPIRRSVLFGEFRRTSTTGYDGGISVALFTRRPGG
jgi:hypothetical protein